MFLNFKKSKKETKRNLANIFDTIKDLKVASDAKNF